MDANLKIFFCVKKKKEEIMIAWYYIAKMPGEVILVQFLLVNWNCSYYQYMNDKTIEKVNSKRSFKTVICLVFTYYFFYRKLK